MVLFSVFFFFFSVADDLCFSQILVILRQALVSATFSDIFYKGSLMLQIILSRLLNFIALILMRM